MQIFHDELRQLIMRYMMKGPDAKEIEAMVQALRVEADDIAKEVADAKVLMKKLYGVEP